MRICLKSCLLKSALLYKQSYLYLDKIEVQQKMEQMLIAFDFDHTIINDNSDTVACKLVPGGIPDEVKQLHRKDGWTFFMRKVFQLLHESNVSKEHIREAMTRIPFTEGMKELIQMLHSKGGDIIIISDSNSVFINDILQHQHLDNCVTAVFTNPAKYNDAGCLEIDMYHYQDWCNLSTKNLCKGYVLETYIEERRNQGKIYSSVAYIGDGKNDFCPSSKLSVNDFVFPRIGYVLVNYIKQMEIDKKLTLKAKVYPWSSGHDILKVLDKSE